MPKSSRTLDLCGKACPFTIVEIGKALRELSPGEVLEVLFDSESLVDDLKAWCEGTGTVLVDFTSQGVTRVYLRKP